MLIPHTRSIPNIRKHPNKETGQIILGAHRSSQGQPGAGGGAQNGQKKSKLCTMYMCVIKICFLNFKKTNHSILGKKF